MMIVPRLFAPTLAVVALVGALARGQDPEPLSLKGGGPAGLRTSVTDAWGVLGIEVQNAGREPRDARVFVFYPGRPDEQYGIDLWVPERTVRTAWAPIGPAAPDRMTTGREVQSLLYDRTGGGDRLVLPTGTERVRSRLVLYRKPDLTTTLLIDNPTQVTPGHETVQFVHALRQLAGQPEHLIIPYETFLPPVPEAFDAVELIVLAGNRLGADPLGRAALRAWVQQGGRLWVMLDRVDPQTVAPILGEDFEAQVVDRVSLTSVRLHRPSDPPPDVRSFDEPVDLVRVLPGGDDRVLTVVDGWPAAFTRPVGRGRVLVTTLGARAWSRPRDEKGKKDPKSPYANVHDLPVALPPMDALAGVMNLRLQPPAFAREELQPVVTEEIGYAVIDRGVVAAVLGAFVLGLVGAGVYLRRTGFPERIGWVGPVAALAAAGVFVALGVSSRRSVPPTVAVAAVVDVVPGSGEGAAQGLAAVYRPESGPVPLGTERGGILDLDPAGLEGQTRRRITTDRGAWHWEGLSLPAGLRTGPFSETVATGPVTAAVRFGPDGVVGRLSVPAFRDLSDALLASANQDTTPVALGADGTFTLGEPLPAGRYLAAPVLSDRQQRRQEIYRKFLGGKWPPHLQDRDVLLAWAEPAVNFFEAGPDSRVTGSALLVVPLTFERPAAGSRVRVPAAFVPYRRLRGTEYLQPTLDAGAPVDQELRFQVPDSVRPMTVDRAVLTIRARAPQWRIIVSGTVDGRPVPLHEVESPTDPVRIEITDPKMLRLDDRGGLTLRVVVRDGDPNLAWAFESMGLEVIGQTRARGEGR